MSFIQQPPIREATVDHALEIAPNREILDVREQNEWDAGHIPGATLVPLGDVADRIRDRFPDLSTPILVHCAVGARSGRAAGIMTQLGYTNVVSMRGALQEWRAKGGAWEAPQSLLSDSQIRRYARQTLIPEIGMQGQRRLLDAKVLLIGAGALGSPSALYLSASGVGTIGLVDDDTVEESNLQRQVLHGADRLGMRKVDSGEQTMTLEVTGEPQHVDNVLARLEPLGIIEMVRTGQVAMRRGDTALSTAKIA